MRLAAGVRRTARHRGRRDGSSGSGSGRPGSAGHGSSRGADGTRPERGPGSQSRSAVPWRKVGPGWALAMYSANQGGEGVKPKAGPSTLYLVSPQGGRYKLMTWSARNPRAQLVAAWLVRRCQPGPVRFVPRSLRHRS